MFPPRSLKCEADTVYSVHSCSPARTKPVPLYVPSHSESPALDPDELPTTEKLSEENEDVNQQVGLDVAADRESEERKSPVATPAAAGRPGNLKRKRFQGDPGTTAVILETSSPLATMKGVPSPVADDMEKDPIGKMDALTAEEINDFYQTFPELSKKFKIVSKIGEGTFSSVYEAVDLEHSEYENGSWQQQTKIQRPDQPGASALQSSKASVALKRIYVTSSPQRIYSEIKILHHLSGHPNIVQLITAIRHEDQVVVVLPLFRHLDFRDYYLDITIAEIRDYMRALLRALEHVHSHKILHRDVKPSNFLYDPKLGTGVLCDFGLAQREENREHRLGMDLGVKGTSNHLVRPRDRPLGYIINDPRPSIRACRAGTRGFRAPEVLLKVLHQTCAIDIWSAGVILLCIFTGRFPFFEANDDQEAFLEIAHIFGKAAMKEVAAQFERRLDTNIPAINKPITFEDLCWKLHSKRALDIPPEGFDLLRKLMALNPRDRITAAEACAHPFLN